MLDGITHYLESPPTPEQFREGYEKEFEAGSEHTLVITANSTNLVVLVEKVELGDLESGTYVGVGGHYRYFIKIDAQNNTVSLNREHKIIGSSTNSNVISETTITNDGEKYSVGKLTFSVNNDGSLKAVYDGDQFDAVLQQ